jgi:hypothetical protein
MTLKELKANILKALYDRYKDNKSVRIGFTELCNQYNIIYDNEKQLSAAFHDLNDKGYIKAFFSLGYDGDIVSFTPAGIEYVEEYLLTKEEKLADSFNDTTKVIKNGVKVDIESSEDGKKVEAKKNKTEKVTTDELFDTKENFKEIVDQGTDPCFGIDKLADCFIKQMDQIAVKSEDKFRMLGIFGPWGRGKTYFFNRIKKKIKERNIQKKNYKNYLSYHIVEFNAWKYQDTPAIWAYLYENLYNSINCWLRICFNAKLLWKRIMFIILVFFLAFLLNVLISTFISLDAQQYFKKLMLYLKIPLFWVTFLSSSFYAFIKKPIPVYKKIKKYIKRKSYNGVLGIQNDLENDIERLIKYIIPKPNKKQLILYVDDIDRCSTDKMLHIINSLRIILENKEIQKRLIVICSIDADKIKEGYCLSKNVERNDEKFTKEAREHLDKLFIFGVGLSPIDHEQQLEYLQHIMDLELNDKEKIKSTAPVSEYREEESLVAVSAAKETMIMDDNIMYRIIDEFLYENKDEVFTPRRLRIMYYRLLFANNILASSKMRMTKEIAKIILNKSINYEEINPNINKALSDVIPAVVPY